MVILLYGIITTIAPRWTMKWFQCLDMTLFWKETGDEFDLFYHCCDTRGKMQKTLDWLCWDAEWDNNGLLSYETWQQLFFLGYSNYFWDFHNGIFHSLLDIVFVVWLSFIDLVLWLEQVFSMMGKRYNIWWFMKCKTLKKILQYTMEHDFFICIMKRGILSQKL